MAQSSLIPFFGLDRQYANLKEELLEAIDGVYSSGRVLGGDLTATFEGVIAKRCNRKYAISINSCTQGMVLTMFARLPKNSKVLIPAISFAATMNSVVMAGHEPVLCDVDHNGMLDLKTIGYKLSDQGIRAIMYVNLFGNMLDWSVINLYAEFFNDGIIVFEDAAQSFGASANGIPSGSFGHASFLSFDPTKNLPNYGSGGMVLTDSLETANILRDLRSNGKYLLNTMVGTNSQMSESDCAQMLVKLRYFDEWQARRTKIAEYYIKEMQPFVDVLGPNEGVTHAWHKFVIRTKSRSALESVLTGRGIETKVHYAMPLNSMISAMDYTDGSELVGANDFSRGCLSLPIYPELKDAEVETVARAVCNFFSG